MLKQRVVTALVLVTLVLVSVFWLPTLWLGAVLGVFMTAAAWEWVRLCGVQDHMLQFLYLLVFLVVGVNLFSLPPLPVLSVSVAWWAWEGVRVWRRRALGTPIKDSSLFMQIRGLFILLPAWYATLYLHQYDPRSPAVLVFLFVMVWLADTGAYIAGSLFGKTKLAPAISPGKTREGVFGALAVVALAALIGGIFVWRMDPVLLILWLAIAAVATLFSVMGDLVESQAKRVAGVKDSGRLFPGHGGVLDRVDAFLAAAPAFALGWTLLASVRP